MADVPATPAPAADASIGMRREILVVLPGLLLAIMLAMLDQLIVGTALPRIVGDLGGVAHLSWVVTAYVLASTISTPLYGKLGDMYGSSSRSAARSGWRRSAPSSPGGCRTR